MFTFAFAGPSATLLVLYAYQGAANWRFLVVGICLGLPALFAGLTLTGFLRGLTECSPAGIRTRGLSGKHQCGWEDVTSIAVREQGGPSPYAPRGGSAVTLSVAVFTRSGRFALGAPISGGVAPDRDFTAKARQIRDYWHAATGRPASRDSAPMPDDFSPPRRRWQW